MVQVPSSRGGTVTVTFTGLNETINKLRNYYSVLPTKEGLGVVKAADFIKEEVKESIVGNRSEPKSVDTGNFANSVEVKPVDDKTLSVFTDVEYSKYLEYGTSQIPARHHFQNTVLRNKNKVKEIVKIEIDNAKKESF